MGSEYAYLLLAVLCSLAVVAIYYFYSYKKIINRRKSQEEFADHKDIPESLSQAIKLLAAKICTYHKAFSCRELIRNLGIVLSIICAGYCAEYIITQITKNAEINFWIPVTFIIIEILLVSTYYFAKDIKTRYGSACKICEDEMEKARIDAKKYLMWNEELVKKELNRTKTIFDPTNGTYLKLENENLRLFIDNTTNNIENTIADTETAIEKKEASLITKDKIRFLPRIKTVIITALPEEYSAVYALLNKPRTIVKKSKADTSDQNTGIDITVGTIKGLDGKKHKIGLFELTQSGNTDSAVYATSLFEHFPKIELAIMCGIAGGIPKIEKLGDVVVSTNGIFQYDYGNEYGDYFIPKDMGKACDEMTRVVNSFRSFELNYGSRWRENIAVIEHNTAQGFLSHPRSECCCLKNEEMDRYESVRRDRPDPITPEVHYGIIASGNQVQRDAKKRDQLHDQRKVYAIEMEGAGIRDSASIYKRKFAVIRGISDFCDEEKNDDWHKYASATAAAYTIGLLQTMKKI